MNKTAKFGAVAVLAATLLAPTFDGGGVRAEAATAPLASVVLEKLAVKGRAPKTGYDRDLFSDGWGNISGCDTRNFILKRDLTLITWRSGENCMVATGKLVDPYTGKTIKFVRGVKTSLAVQIDHVVAVSDAWQKGAQQISSKARYSFYNDPLNLLAVDGPTNSAKGDGDAAAGLARKPANLTRLSAKNGGKFPTTRVMAQIWGYAGAKGRGVMPDFGPLLQGDMVPYDGGDGIETPTPIRLVQLAEYLKVLQAK